MIEPGLWVGGVGGMSVCVAAALGAAAHEGVPTADHMVQEPLCLLQFAHLGSDGPELFTDDVLPSALTVVDDQPNLTR